MKKIVCSGLTLAATIFALAGCTPGAATPAATPAPTATVQAKPAQDNKWDQLVAEARKEGKVVIYTAGPNDIRPALSEPFKKRYGIELEFVFGRGAELMAKIQNERRANLFLTDVGMLGLATYTTLAKQENITLPIQPLLVLPEVLDPKQYYGGKLPALDKEGNAFAVALFAMPAYIYNTDVVKPADVPALVELASAKWKDKIVLGDPTIPGMGNDWYATTMLVNLGPDKGRQFMKSLAPNIAVATRDHRQLTEWVARAKYSIGIGASPSVPPEFIQNGAPVNFLDLKEARPIATGWGLVNLLKNAPHPKAAQVFVNWLYTLEGTAAFIQGSNYPTARLGASTASILPVMIPRQGDAMTSDEYENAKPNLIKMAAEDFAAVLK